MTASPSQTDLSAQARRGRTTAPFAQHERLIAWRYLRAKRSEGGVSVMTWISLIGITLAVFALIATLAVRSGFRAEFVDTILGANAHVTVYYAGQADEFGYVSRTIDDFDAITAQIAMLPSVTRAAPLVKSQVMVTANGDNAGVEIYGMRHIDIEGVPRVAQPERASGSLDDYPKGIALGSGVARNLGVSVGDMVKMISPEGAVTPMGRVPRVKSYPVVYIFTAGRYDIDNTRAYLPLPEAQSFFNREGVVDEIEVMVIDPDRVDIQAVPEILAASPQRALTWTWRDASGSFLRALEVEDNVMFVIMAILVMIASMNIISGLVMLVKNKQRDIAILRTIGLSQGAILRIFMMCGAFTGIIGTVMGTILGCLFALYIDPIFSLVNYVAGGGVWDPSIRGLYNIPALLRLEDVIKAISLSLILSCTVTYFPARRAAKINPVEGLRYE